MRSGPRLRLQINAGAAGDFLQQGVIQLRLLIGHALGFQKDLGRAAFNQIGRQGERRAGKANQRHLESAAEQADGFQYKGQALFRVGNAQPVNGGLCSHWLWKNRPLALVEFELKAHRLHRNQNIRKKNGSIKAKNINRLERDFRAQLRAFAQLQKADFAAHGLIFGQIAARLAHEPDRRVFGALAPAGFKKYIVHFIKMDSNLSLGADYTEYTAKILYGPGSDFSNLPSSRNCFVFSNDCSKQCSFISISDAR